MSVAQFVVTNANSPGVSYRHRPNLFAEPSFDHAFTRSFQINRPHHIAQANGLFDVVSSTWAMSPVTVGMKEEEALTRKWACDKWTSLHAVKH